MPMYFPDLKSVQKLAIDMSSHQGDKKYTGIIPGNDEELSKAREQLASYMRRVWQDEVFALEIELAVNPKDYELKMGAAVVCGFIKDRIAFKRQDADRKILWR